MGAVKDLVEKYSGETYPYQKYIKNNDELGVSSSGSMGSITTNVGALINYTKVLISGNSRASKAPGNGDIGGPLGSKQFISTIAKCTDIDSGELKSRSIYVNNIPTGNLNALDIDMGSNMRGLVPGLVNNITGLMNPGKLFSAFTESSYPPCKEVTFSTRDKFNVTDEKKGFVTIDDLEDLYDKKMVDITAADMSKYKAKAIEKKTLKNKEGFNFMEMDQNIHEIYNKLVNDMSCDVNKIRHNYRSDSNNHDMQPYVLFVVLLYSFLYMKLVYK